MNLLFTLTILNLTFILLFCILIEKIIYKDIELYYNDKKM